MTIFRSIHVAENGTISFFLSNIVYMYHIIFIHSSSDGHLGCVQVFTIVNSAVMNIGVHVLFWIMFFYRCITQSGNAGSNGSSNFCFLRNLHVVLLSGSTNLHAH